MKKYIVGSLVIISIMLVSVVSYGDPASQLSADVEVGDILANTDSHKLFYKVLEKTVDNMVICQINGLNPDCIVDPGVVPYSFLYGKVVIKVRTK